MQLLFAVFMASFLRKGHSDLHVPVWGGDSAIQIQTVVCQLGCDDHYLHLLQRQKHYCRGLTLVVRAQLPPDLVPGLPAPRVCSYKTSVFAPTFHILCVADDGVQGLFFLILRRLCAVHPDSRNAGGRNVVPEAPVMEYLSLETCCCSFC